MLLLLLQALSWSHARGRAHCDLKLDNLAFCMDCEAGGVSYIRLMDHGGSIRYAGADFYGGSVKQCA